MKVNYTSWLSTPFYLWLPLYVVRTTIQWPHSGIATAQTKALIHIHCTTCQRSSSLEMVSIFYLCQFSSVSVTSGQTELTRLGLRDRIFDATHRVFALYLLEVLEGNCGLTHNLLLMVTCEVICLFPAAQLRGQRLGKNKRMQLPMSTFVVWVLPWQNPHAAPMFLAHDFSVSALVSHLTSALDHCGTKLRF